MKQTAVDWLIHILKGQQDKPFNFEEWMIAMEHAKAMEKEQIFEAFKTGTKMVDVENEFDALFNAIIYYKETYESKTNI